MKRILIEIVMCGTSQKCGIAQNAVYFLENVLQNMGLLTK